jgi:hypothetical protein
MAKKEKINVAKAIRAAILELCGNPPATKKERETWAEQINTKAILAKVDAEHGEQEWGKNPSARISSAKTKFIEEGFEPEPETSPASGATAPLAPKAPKAIANGKLSEDAITKARELVTASGGLENATKLLSFLQTVGG